MDISNNTGVKSLFGISLIAALAGFIFGFDTVVISGANLPIKELWHTTPLFHGFFIMSMALWGTVLGSIFGGIPTEKYGMIVKRLCKYCDIKEESKYTCNNCKKIQNKKEWAIVRYLRKVIDTKFEYNSSKCYSLISQLYFNIVLIIL